MAKILILNPPSPDGSYINRDLMGGLGVHNLSGKYFLAKLIFKIKSTTVHIPVMQLVNAATILHSLNNTVYVVDAVNTGKKLSYVIEEVQKFQPDFIVMAISSGCFKFERDVVAKNIKTVFPKVKLIVVGDVITERPSELLPWFDIAIVGEIEQSIAAIIENQPYDSIPSIIWQEQGKIKQSLKGKTFILTKKLEELPFPAWQLFPFNWYSYYPMLTVNPVALIQASRGCPYGCGYCPYPINQGRQWRARSAQNVFDEINWDVSQFGFKAFFFRDPLFTADQKRVSELCDLLLKSRLKIKFAFETRPELLNMPGLIEKLAKAGCRAINFGVEDIHPEILKQINRNPLSLDEIRNTVTQCEKAGIRTSCFFILGLPGSNFKTVAETIDFSKKLFPSQIEYKIAMPFPGTALYDLAKKNKWIVNEDFDALGGYSATMIVSPDLTEKYLTALVEKSFIEFYFNPRYLLRYILRAEFLNTIRMILRAKFFELINQ